MSVKQKLLIIEQKIEWTCEQIYVAENTNLPLASNIYIKKTLSCPIA